jgi:hypothetical protein
VKKDPFYFEIKDVVTQFVAAFDDVVIKRFNKAREAKERVQVRYVYSPKKRVLHDLVNKAQHITIPVIAVNIAGISRDESRIFNKIEGSLYNRNHLLMEQSTRTIPVSSNVTRPDYLPQPVPVNISINMSMITKFQTDMDQILSNFIPYSDPYVIISWKVPGEFIVTEQEIRSEVLWSGDINLEYPTNLDNTNPYRITADTSFTIKGWLFKKHIEDYTGTVLQVNANIYDGFDLAETIIATDDGTTIVPVTGSQQTFNSEIDNLI